MEEKQKSRVTEFLERNKIWFTAVIPTLISIGVAGAGIASCQADFKQIELTNIEIEEKNMEKQPFFSIRQDFNKQRNQYIYKIVNTGGEVRYSDIQISPYLNVVHRAEDGHVTNEAFIYIPHCYQDEPLSNNDELMAFSDKWADMNDTNSSYYVEDGNMVVLNNDYLQFLCVSIIL